MMVPLLHHGMVVMGVPFSEAALAETATGGGPYGASHVSGTGNTAQLSSHEQAIAFAQGQRLATMAQKLA